MTPIASGRWFWIVRLGLFESALGWGISFVFTIYGWPDAVAKLESMGADPIAYQPLLAYWLKMASAVFGGIGVASALAFLWPDRYEAIIRLLAPFHLALGGVLIAAAVANGLEYGRHPTFVWDITFCFTTAALIGVPQWFGK
jgi:hypothetical protein